MFETGYLWGPPPSGSVIFPPTMRQGDSWEFSLYSPQYAPPTAEEGPWTATAVFASGTTRIESVATVEGQTFNWVVLPADTSAFPTGPASYVIQVDNGTLRRTLEQGAINVIADISDPATDVDSVSDLAEQLAAADACLLDLLNQRVSMTSFGGKQYQLWNIKDLWAVRNAIAARLADEQAAAAGNTRHRVILPTFLNM